MAKRNVQVLIKARDEASKKFLHIGGAAKLMGKMLKSVGSGIKTVFVTALKAAKYAVMALGVALAGCTYKALKQEAAEVELASALRITNQYSEEAMHRLKEQAAAIQDVTKYGDEYTLGLMRMAITLGVTEDKAADAAKAAIALHAGFGGGRGKPEIFLRYYIDALRGTGSSLESYVGELRKAKTEEEKHIILQRNLAKGWDAAKSKAESAGGALSRMKNKLGDIAEVIASPLLPVLKRGAEAIIVWAKENEANVAWWAQKTFSYVTLIKDVFWDFVVFMRRDWRAGLGFVFDSFLELLKATFESAVLLAISGGRAMMEGFKKGLLGKEHGERRLLDIYEARVKQLSPELTRKYPTTPIPLQPYQIEGLAIEKLRAAAKKRLGTMAEQEQYSMAFGQAKREYAAGQMRKIIGSSLEVAGETFKESFAKILKDVPEDLRKETEKAWKKHLQRLEELGAKPGRKPLGLAGAVGAPSVFDIPGLSDVLKETRSQIMRGLAPRQARFLTFAPGAKFTYEQQTAQNTKELVKSQKQLAERITGLLRRMDRFFNKVMARPQLALANFQ